MTSKDVGALLEEKDKAAILRMGRKPLLAAYRVAHEGISTGPLSGVGRAAKRWDASQIRELAEKLSSAPVYIGHYSGAGPRRPVGYVLRARSLEGSNGAEVIAVVAIEDPRAAWEIDDGVLDTASVEAELALEPAAAGDKEWKVASVESVTGLALASAKRHSPGFQHATLLACTQELDAEETATTEPPPAPSVEESAKEIIGNLNLTDSERGFVMRRVAERLGEQAVETEKVKGEVNLAINALDEAKRLYRRPPAQVPVPFERRRGPMNYTDPEHNELIPRTGRRYGGT
jgi:hypothetical protein